MSQQSPQKPSLGRVVLFSRPDREERAADVVRISPETDTITLHVKTPSHNKPIEVDYAPLQEGATDAQGRSWRWPPRV